MDIHTYIHIMFYVCIYVCIDVLNNITSCFGQIQQAGQFHAGLHRYSELKLKEKEERGKG